MLPIGGDRRVGLNTSREGIDPPPVSSAPTCGSRPAQEWGQSMTSHKGSSFEDDRTMPKFEKIKSHESTKVIPIVVPTSSKV